MALVFKIVEEMSTAKNYHSVSLPSVVSKAFQLVNNSIVHHMEKYGLFQMISMLLGLLDQEQIF